MKKTLLLLALTFMSALSIMGAEWETDFSKALKLSTEKKIPILMLFTGSDWCPACKVLEANVLKDKKFDSTVKDKVVLLYLDFPRKKKQSEELKKQNMQLQMQYRIPGYPTLLLVDLSGKVLAKQSGAFGSFDKFQNWFDNGLKVAIK